MRPLLVMQLTILLALANGAPILVAKLLGTCCSYPLDGGLIFFDGARVLGDAKTARGLAAGVLASVAGAIVMGMPAYVGAAVGTGAIAGDALSSFIKRRMGLRPSSQATGLDQIPESLLPLLICRFILPVSALEITVVVGIFFFGEIVLSRVLYHAHMRDRPY